MDTIALQRSHAHGWSRSAQRKLLQRVDGNGGKQHRENE
jgi:hypothetical protein